MLGCPDDEVPQNPGVNLRVFENEQGRFDRSLLDVGGEALVVSQFTLYADCSKGRRPSFTDAAEPELARGVVDLSVELNIEYAKECARRGADFVMTGDDYAATEQPLMSPKVFREILYPGLKRVFAGFKEAGLYTIKHSDGNIRPLLDMILDAQPDCLDPHGKHAKRHGQITHQPRVRSAGLRAVGALGTHIQHVPARTASQHQHTAAQPAQKRSHTSMRSLRCSAVRTKHRPAAALQTCRKTRQSGRAAAGKHRWEKQDRRPAGLWEKVVAGRTIVISPVRVKRNDES